MTARLVVATMIFLGACASRPSQWPAESARARVIETVPFAFGTVVIRQTPARTPDPERAMWAANEKFSRRILGQSEVPRKRPSTTVRRHNARPSYQFFLNCPAGQRGSVSVSISPKTGAPGEWRAGTTVITLVAPEKAGAGSRIMRTHGDSSLTDVRDYARIRQYGLSQFTDGLSNAPHCR